MLITITNKTLSAVINTKGAELIKLEKNNVNYIWEVDTAYWNKTSPVLFPIVGALKENKYTINDNVYSLPRHGFARDMEFVVEKQTDNQVIFTLSSTEETKENYPFDFNFKLAYTLVESELVIEYLVQNLNNEVLPFSLGAHPAFTIEGDLSDYSLEFNKDEVFVSTPLEKDLLLNENMVIESYKNEIKLNYDLFANDALVFKSLKSDEVVLKHLNTPLFKLIFEFFPHLGIWTKENAPFLCIEPWCGYADIENHNGDFMEKEGIQLVQPNENFLRAIRIEIY